MRLEGRADPIHYDGSSDVGERVSHPFVLWLAADSWTHVPLRLEMPLGPSQMVVALVSVERDAAAAYDRSADGRARARGPETT